MSEQNAKQQLKFVHLRVHSSYSLSEGAIRPEKIAPLASQNNMPAVAVTDTSNLFGLLENSLSCKKNGVQLIPAVEANFVTDREKGLNLIGKIVLLAKNETGYLNLLKILSKSYSESLDIAKPVITKQDLFDNKEGLICLSGGYNGFMDLRIKAKKDKELDLLLREFKDQFGYDFYLELNRLGQDKQIEVETELLNYAKDLDIPIVATNNVLFPTKEMHEAQDILMCISQGVVLEDSKREKYTKEHYFKSQEQMAELFEDLPEALENTINIAKKCSYLVNDHPPMLPHFPTEGGRSEEDELRHVAFRGLCERLEISHKPSDDEKKEYKEYFERLDYELGIINKMEFPGYFLIVSDFMRWAKSQDIPVGPGRGSGAGSVVAWALQITNLDPLRFGLLFERFLNPERVSMPDFDIDFCQERRGEVISYVQDKYGHENVAQIITFGKLQARAVLRDVGRVMQIPYSKTDRICKMIPFNPVDPVTLAKAVEMDPDLQNEIETDEVTAKLVDIGLKLEGMHRHASTHAAGVVIGPKPLVEILPIYYDSRSTMPITQYSMKYSEMAGLVKFDFLGLKTLTLISKAVKMVKKNEGVEIDVDNLPWDDKKTFEMLAQGSGIGVFQMESAGMRDSMRKMKVDSIEDIIALISLYRPGPMENIPRYIACKHGIEKPDYLHPLLNECLKETYGVIIYQEQVMQIAQILGGYTLGAADLLRRAMGKKIKAEMDNQRKIFVKGAVENNVDKNKAEEIFDLVAKFAGYGFNKSHAAAYAAIGYQTAYLKAHYPAEFLCACMNMVIQDTDKILMFREEARRMGIEVKSPDINYSCHDFTVEIDPKTKVKSVRYALSALKNVGAEAIENMIIERTENGEYKNIDDFIERVDKSVMNKRQLESLSASGAFDSIHNNRRQIFEEAQIIAKYNQTLQEEKNNDQSSLFGIDENVIQNKSLKLKDIEDWKGNEKILKEFEAIGFYLNNHPVKSFYSILPKSSFQNIVDLEEVVPFTVETTDKYGRKKSKGYSLTLVGVANRIVHRTSNGRRFSYFSLSDPTGMTEVNIFNDSLINQSRDILESNKPITVKCEAKRDEGGMRIVASDIILLTDYIKGIKSNIELSLDEEVINDEFLRGLKNIVVNDNLDNEKDDDAKLNLNLSLGIKTQKGFEIKIKIADDLCISTEKFEDIKSIPNISFNIN